MGTWDWMDELTNPRRLAALAPPSRAAASEVWPEELFAALFHQHYSRLVAALARMLGERSQAEEIVGDAFWKLYHLPRLQAEGNNVPGWLYRTATRMGIDALRGQKRWRLGWDRLLAQPVAAPRLDDQLNAMLRDEAVSRVRAVLRQLRPAQAQLLVLRHSGLSYLEIAAALGMKPSSVGTTLARAEAAFERAYTKGEL